MDDSSEEDERLNAPNLEVREVLRALDRAGLENMLPVWDEGRMIVEEGHVALKEEMKFATRKYRASPLNSSPLRNLQLPLTSETSNMGMILLSAEESEKNPFETRPCS